MDIFSKLKFEILDYNKIQNYLDNPSLNFEKHNDKFIVEGFTLFSKALIRDIVKYNKGQKYILENLSQFEIQEDYNSNPLYYSRFIVALHKEKIVGILICQWIKDELPFWRYHERYIDVHKKYRQKGIAKKIYHILDNSDFLKNHIIQWSIFSAIGRECSKGIPGYFLKVENYIFIPNDYCLLKPPLEIGRYNSCGKKIN